MTSLGDRRVVAWALYDWGNSAFATTVMAGFFPLFFKRYWSAGGDPTVSTFQLGIANSAGSLAIVMLAPVLGAIADRGAAKKKFLLLLAVTGMAMTAALPLVARGDWPLAVALYVLAVVGFSGGNVFYDALILRVAERPALDRVSAFGYALGYLGGGLLFALNVSMVRWPSRFGLAGETQAVQASFVLVALWWALFTVPLVLFVEEPGDADRVPAWSLVKAGLAQLRETFRQARRLRTVALFLVAYWFYIDGVHTIIRMAVDYGMALGFDAGELIVALLVTQFVGFPATLAFGYLGQRVGPRSGVLAGLAVYVAISTWAVFMRSTWEFYALAGAIGLAQGGVQSLSRSLYARLIPAAQSAEFFGFFNMMGKFAAVLGPLLMGVVSVTTGDPRLSIVAVIGLFLIGGGLLLLVRETE